MVKDMRPKQRSIIRNFSFTLAAAMLAVAVIVFLGGYVAASTNAVSELRSKANEQLAQLQEILKTPLWNYSAREVKIIGDAYMQNAFVSSLLIQDSHGENLYFNEKADSGFLFTLNSPITFHNEVIGSVQFSVSDTYLNALKQNFLWSYVAAIAVVLVITLLLAGLSLRLFLQQSLINFINLVKDYSQGNDAAFDGDVAYVEFKPLISVLKKMSESIAASSEAMKTSDARLTAFFNESPIGMVIYDADGRHLKVNETLTKVSGISVAAHIGKTMHDLLPQDIADPVEAIRQQVMETGQAITWEVTGVLPEASQEIQYLLNTFFPIPGPDGKPMAVGGGIVDISALKYAQRELELLNSELEHRVQDRTDELAHEKERAENYLQIAGAMIVALDEDGNITLINDKGCAVLGYSKSDLIGKNWFETVIRPDEQAAVQDALSQIMDGQLEAVEQFENHVLTHDGIPRLIAWHNTVIRANDGTIIGALSAGLDITEQRQIQDSLQEAYELNETIFANSPVGIAIYDPRGQCVSVNQSFADIVGATPKQLLEQNYHTIASWQECGLYEHVQDTLSSGVSSRQEVAITTSFGKTLVTDCHLVPISIYSQTHLLLTFSDVTELKKVQEQLIQSSKMATLGEMATGVAHELNQPLNVIRLVVANIQRKAEKGPFEPGYLADKLAKVVSQIERAAAVIDHMRIFGRTPSAEMAPLDAGEMIDAAVGLIGEQLRLSDIALITEIPDVSPSILGHQVQIEQVLLNLLSNARDAINEAQSTYKQIYLGIRNNDEANTLGIYVEDTGGGIPNDVLPRIFDPFFTTKNIGHGTGLGLSISYGIVRDMGGTLEAENIEHGARFTITLPRYDSISAV